MVAVDTENGRTVGTTAVVVVVLLVVEVVVVVAVVRGIASKPGCWLSEPEGTPNRGGKGTELPPLPLRSEGRNKRNICLIKVMD